MDNKIQSICVFCGSRKGFRPVYARAARELADALIERDLTLVYGGGGIGLMGILADAVLAQGGRVVGVIPEHLCRKELLHDNLSDLHVTSSLLERKLLMMELADAFIALPGGLGTFDEILEVYTWAQLGRHRKPIGLVNTHGYFAPFLSLVEHAIDEGFLDARYRETLLIDPKARSLVVKLLDPKER